MTHVYTITRSVVSPEGRVKPVGQTRYQCRQNAINQLVSHALRFDRDGWQVKFEDETAFTAVKSPDAAGFYYEIEAG